jgi:hypothetical protein
LAHHGAAKKTRKETTMTRDDRTGKPTATDFATAEMLKYATDLESAIFEIALTVSPDLTAQTLSDCDFIRAAYELPDPELTAERWNSA